MKLATATLCVLVAGSIVSAMPVAAEPDQEFLTTLERRYVTAQATVAERFGAQVARIRQRSRTQPVARSSFEFAFREPLSSTDLSMLSSRFDLYVSEIKMLSKLDNGEMLTVGLRNLGTANQIEQSIENIRASIGFQAELRRRGTPSVVESDLSTAALNATKASQIFIVDAVARYEDAAAAVDAMQSELLIVLDTSETIPSEELRQKLSIASSDSAKLHPALPRSFDGGFEAIHGAKKAGGLLQGITRRVPAKGPVGRTEQSVPFAFATLALLEIPSSASCSGPFSCPSPNTWVPADSDYSAIISDIVDPLFGVPLSMGNVLTAVRWSGAIEEGVVINLAAFRGSQFTHCDTANIFQNPLDSPCLGPDQLFVEDAAVEDEFEMRDNNCLIVHTGDPTIDFGQGCLTVQAWASTLPLPILDTSFLDPAEEFKPTIIGRGGISLVPNQTYLSQSFFGGFGHRVAGLIGTTSQQNSQINQTSPAGSASPFQSFKVNEQDKITEYPWFPLLF